MASFAISAYASSYYRAGSKPFNPVLGETYECVRKDKGFQYFAEQVDMYHFLGGGGYLGLPLNVLLKHSLPFSGFRATEIITVL